MVESDEEQLEVLKNWWKENGQSIVIAIALAFFGIFGLQAWNEKLRTLVKMRQRFINRFLI